MRNPNIYGCFGISALGINNLNSSRFHTLIHPMGISTYISLMIFIPLTIYLEDKYTVVLQTGNTFRHFLWFPIYIFLIILIVNVIVRTLHASSHIACKLNSNDSNTVGRIFRAGLIIIIAMIVILQTFSPNPFADLKGGVYHLDAYANSILNATKFIPYSYEVNSIYGHY